MALASERDLTLMVGHLLCYHPGSPARRPDRKGRPRRRLLPVLPAPQPRQAPRRRERALEPRCARRLGAARAGRRPPQRGHRPRRAYVRDGVEDVVFAYIRFDSGLAAHLHLSWLDPHKERRLTVVGSERMATLDDMALERKLTIYDKGFDPAADTYGEYITCSGAVVSPAVPNDEPLRSNASTSSTASPTAAPCAPTAPPASRSCRFSRRSRLRSTRAARRSRSAPPSALERAGALTGTVGRAPGCCWARARSPRRRLGGQRRDPRRHHDRRGGHDQGRRNHRQAAQAGRALAVAPAEPPLPPLSVTAPPSARARWCWPERRSAPAPWSATRPRCASGPRSGPRRSSDAAARSTTTSRSAPGSRCRPTATSRRAQ